jgi:hypothetical protein
MILIQRGTGPHVLVMVFTGTAASKAPKILGPTVTVYAVAGSRLSDAEIREVRRLRDAAAAAGGQLWTCGYSAGGGAVRASLDSIDPDGCIIADGGPISLPGQPQTMPRRQYERFVELAKKGERQFIASHTYLTYTEQIVDDPRTPQVENPWASTVNTLRQITGLALPEPAVGQHTVTTLGGITILSYESGPADRPAHARQVQEVLPMMLETYLRPRLAPRGALAAVVAVAGSIKAAVISAAEQAVQAVDNMGQTPAPDGYLSHGWRCAVAELVADAKKTGRWHEQFQTNQPGQYQVKVGDLVISKRSGQDPRTGGSGHVERLTHVCEGTPEDASDVTIGGNESNTWIEANLNWREVVGIIDVDSAIGRRAIDLSRAELQARVAERPGTAAHPRIQAYHAGARRGGSELAGMPGRESEAESTLGQSASDEIPWCASAASWAAYHAALEVMP